jgi:hypothetical protein
MEPIQPTQRAPILRIITSVFVGVLASVLSVTFFLCIARTIFSYLTAMAFESGWTLALMIDIICVAPLALITFIPVGVLTGRFTHKALARVAVTRGSHAERRTSLSIFGIAGITIFLATLVFVIYQALPLIPGEEREVLTKLGNRLTWKSPCNGRNVVCDGNFLSAHVTEYRGGYHSLKSIPPEINQLSNLEVLDLSRGQLNNISPELSQLSHLKILDLSHNQLKQVPPELGTLSSLEHLKLNNNQLSGAIPPELGNLSNLRGLYLAHNQFSGSLPLELSNLSRLNKFTFNNTNLCEPTDAAFQEWLSGIRQLAQTEVACP